MNHPFSAQVVRRIWEQVAGFILFPAVNGMVWWMLEGLRQFMTNWPADTLPTQMATVISLLFPWLVNGAVLVFVFWRRPWVGIGYMAFLGWVICVVVVSGILFLPGCLIALAATAILPGTPTFMAVLLGTLACGLVAVTVTVIVFFVVLAGGI